VCFFNRVFQSDAVAEAMASKLGVSKADILDPTSENLAVRLALAETNIITETKDYLEEVNIDSPPISVFKKWFW
jgi:multiple RNA-binding domain-containing protein 1